MKQIVVTLCAVLMASVGLANHHEGPITSFPEGQYLGSGNFTTNQGQEGVFATYAEIGYNWWDVAHYVDGQIRQYGAFTNFDEYGFFDIEMTYLDENGEEATSTGRGYCRSVQCHYSLLVGDKVVEETISFLTWENRIYWLGSVTPHGATEDNFSVSWELALARIE